MLNRLFFIFYYFFVSFIYVFSLPFLLILPFVKSKFRQSLPARFFLCNNKFKSCDLWVHACSLGEVTAIKPFIEGKDVFITTITKTGQDAAKKLSAKTGYLPYEMLLPFWVKRANTLVILEAEFWLMMVVVAKLKGMKVVLLNTRISEKSYPKYLRFAFFYKIFFKYVDIIYAQSKEDKTRLKSLGAKDIQVVGNIKTIAKIKTTKTYTKSNQEVITIASSHKDEEKLILDSLDIGNRKIIVVPRHPERFIEVSEYLAKFSKNRNLSFSKFSETENFDSDVVLVDVLGELVNIYAITDITILCGSFVDGIGGHNPLEPATFNNKIISGKYIFNQKSLYPSVENILITQLDNINDTISKAIHTYIKKIANKSDISI
ncbi:MAG: Lipid IVA 3-deoxy-D-manno-octulosonic acid transferase (EC [often with (EC also] [uncultured Campylobacterales bacterium]|uniref:3-deoxy-D-manno-octulosonic acid transferase n=1 Tax=uncultured Campylobacterales bacterium TaxID=352960 RepID=A0A6S6SWK6_9BACT|nr:MAG: Lipid IVA 3-deoxy-D-manno-octulosonic acid transferase (EC [often with (EC also] [uncultured Campylobacterales bacterium]